MGIIFENANERKEKEARLARIEAEIQGFRNELNSDRQRVDVLIDSLSQIESEISKLKQDVNYCQVHINNLQEITETHSENAKTQISEVIRSTKLEIASFESRINGITASIESVESRLEESKKTINTKLNDINEESEKRSSIRVDKLAGLSRSLHQESLDSILETDTQLRQYVYDEISATEGRVEEKLQRIIGMLKDVVHTNVNLVKENQELRKSLEFYTEIESDSAKLNDTSEKDHTAILLDAMESSTGILDYGKSLKELRDEDDNSDTPGRIIDSSKKGRQPIDNSISIHLDNEQQEAIDLLKNTSQNIFITGKAGTGKSFLLYAFIRAAEKANLKIIKVAPTGVAALNINGATIHRTFGFDNLENIDIADLNKRTIRLKFPQRIVLQEADVVIIDEVSMVNSDIFDKLDKILRIVCNDERLFAGKRFIIFGDIFQLSPVITSKEKRQYLKDKYGSEFFFDSYAYKTGNFRFIELKTNHRQKEDAKFFELLNRIREGTTTKEDYDMLNRRVLSDNSKARRILTLYSTKSEADQVNKSELAKIRSKEYRYIAEITYNKKSDQGIYIDSNFPIQQELVLKVGALVMMVANDLNGRWVNGTLGIIKKLEPDKIFVSINSEVYEVFPETFTEAEAVYKDGKITYEDVFEVSQYPIVLAYAMTIHKSQGMTYQTLACDLSRCFAPGQAYVALSRCSSLEGLYLLSEVNNEISMVDSRVAKFYLLESERNA